MSDAARRPKAYHRIKYGVFFADLALSAAILAFLQFAPIGGRLAALAAATSPLRPLQVAAYMAAFFIVFYAASFPLSVYSGHVVEKRFGLTDQRFSGWLVEDAKKTALSLALFVFSMTALYWFGERFPRTWWIWAGAGWFALSAGLARVLPTLVLPIFYRTEPLEDGPLKRRVLDFCRERGVPVLGAFRLGLSKTTRKANAALIGLGKSRRVLLADTLLKDYPDDEVMMVVAHEVGHHALKHIGRGLVFSGALAFGGFYLLCLASARIASSLGAPAITDLAVFPAIAFLASAAGLLMLPAQNAYSRFLEREADRYALRHLPSLGTFRSLMERLSRQNLGDPEPDPLVEFVFYSHPSLKNRLKHAETVYASPHSASGS